MNTINTLTCPCCCSDLEYDQGTQPTCTNGVPDEGIEPCYYCEECGHEENGDLLVDEEEELPCYRELEEDGTWWCVNDHTGCFYNDGNNGCNCEGKSVCPLEEETE